MSNHLLILVHNAQRVQKKEDLHYEKKQAVFKLLKSLQALSKSMPFHNHKNKNLTINKFCTSNKTYRLSLCSFVAQA